jgi:hypothetical protein
MIAGELFARAGSPVNYSIIIPGGTPSFESHPSTENLSGRVWKESHKPKRSTINGFTESSIYKLPERNHPFRAPMAMPC